MSTTPVAKVCAVCNRVLASLEGEDGSLQWVHGLQDDDHMPVPVDREDTVPEFRCDFCNMDESTWRLPVRSFPLPFSRSIEEALNAEGAPQHMSSGDWAACDTCARYIELNQWNAVLRRAVTHWERTHGKMNHIVRTSLSTMHKTVRKNIKGPLEPFVHPSRPPETSGVTEWGQNRPGGPRA